MAVEKIILFGDDWGMPALVEATPADLVGAIVGAEIRPQSHDALSQAAKAIGVPFMVQPRVQSEDYQVFIGTLRTLAPDLILVNSYSMLLRPDLLAIPCHGAINIHGALLPQYRGSNPIQWALINDEWETGTTMHYMSESFDQGDIIAENRIPILFEDTWVDIHRRLSEANHIMLREQLPLILKLENERTPQDEGKARYYRRRTPEDGQINWAQPARDIYNLIRALVRPLPGAFYFDDGKKIVLDTYFSLEKVREIQDSILRNS